MRACVALARLKLGCPGGPECEREKTERRVYVRLLPSHFSVITSGTSSSGVTSAIRLSSEVPPGDQGR